MSETPALVVAAAGVGLGHAVLPDHWVPLAMVGRTRHYPLSKVARLSAAAGVAHVVVSVILGAVIVAIGLQFRSSVEHAQDAIVGGLLILTGLGFIVVEVSGLGHHHDHPHDHLHEQRSRVGSAAAVMVPFGAAASPDLTILPVFLAAAAVGPSAAVGSLLAFAAVTVATIVTLTLAAAAAGFQVRGAWLDRWGNTLTAVVLITIGTLIAAGAL